MILSWCPAPPTRNKSMFTGEGYGLYQIWYCCQLASGGKGVKTRGKL